MTKLASLSIVVAACAGQVPGGGDDGSNMPDAGTTNMTCPLPASTPDAGTVTALKAQECNVSGSMGAAHWYRLAVQLPTPMDYVHPRPWANTGAFAGGARPPGTFPLPGGAPADSPGA